NPAYHLKGIVSSFKSAAEKMPRVDAIGVSSAGVYINNRPMVASLFRAVPEDLYDKHVKGIYAEAAKALGGVPIKVINDGDVTALAGAMSSGHTAVMGIAMGTSEAAGYVDRQGHITGWLNELAFATVDMNSRAARDEWSGDAGVGACWFSQDGVIRLAAEAGIALSESATPAELLSYMQQLLEDGPPLTSQVFADIGCAFAHTIAYYARFYDIDHVLLLGRVMSGRGGDIILENACETLKADYPELTLELKTPDEKMRRLGQSVAAASL
ncbi:MAG: ROK family protein, partial [Oscillospiraceae bacterium]|nr:ROK family protein [Oscillospiraceae bacterium]